MRRLAALGLIVFLLVGIATPADACGSPCGVAIGLASFFFLSALLAPLTYPYGYPYPYYGYPAYYPAYGYPAYGYPAYTSPVAYQPPMMYTSRPVVSQPRQAAVQPAPPAQTRVVHYPHGRYELRGDGVTTAYLWVWVVTESPGNPSLASLPPAAPPPGPTQ
jgi:hypothetical protein